MTRKQEIFQKTCVFLAKLAK